jgi:Fe2+ transport system protein FeoA
MNIADIQRHHRTLPELKAHESAETIAFTHQELACKLTTMGVRPGVRIEMVRPSPFGDAFYVKIDGVRLALRAEEAAHIVLLG